MRRWVWPRTSESDRLPRWVRPVRMAGLLLALVLGAQGIRFLHDKFGLPFGPGGEQATELYVMPDGKIVELPAGTSFGKKPAE